jgi:hypothetical protein
MLLLLLGVYEPRRGATNLWELDLSPNKYRSSSLNKKMSILKDMGSVNSDTGVDKKLLSSLSVLSLPITRSDSKHYDESFKSMHSLTR